VSLPEKKEKLKQENCSKGRKGGVDACGQLFGENYQW